jgi:RNA polymerase sigma-70 factor (family 1)
LLNSNEQISEVEHVNSRVFNEALRVGDEAAFKVLFDTYQHKLFGYINKIVKSREVSEELVLDIFLKIWNAKEMLREVQHLDAFLYRMAVNKALDFLKAASREDKLRELLAMQMKSLSSEAPDDAYIYKEYERELLSTIKQLPAQQQLIFNLSRENGMSHQEIAAELNISKNTVKNHLVAAIKKLKGIVRIVIFFF